MIAAHGVAGEGVRREGVCVRLVVEKNEDHVIRAADLPARMFDEIESNDAARLQADSWDASLLTLPEYIRRNGLSRSDDA
jgi:hypothetical protein